MRRARRKEPRVRPGRVLLASIDVIFETFTQTLMPALSKKDIEHYRVEGYVIQKGVFSKDEMNDLYIAYYDLAYHQAKRKNLLKNTPPPNTDVISKEHDVQALDDLILLLLKNDKDNIGEVYDAFSYSSAFLRFISKREVENTIQELLCLETTATLYGWTNRVRIDPPGDNRRTYGWHQETFYTHPEFHYLQTWAPIIRNTTKNNGTIRIKPKSHKEGIPPQTWNEISGRATQILIDPEVLSKYPQRRY